MVKEVAKPWLSGNKSFSGWRDKGGIFGGGWKRARPLMKQGLAMQVRGKALAVRDGRSWGAVGQASRAHPPL